MNLQFTFKLTLFVTLLIKFILAGVIPLSGDEAYFVIWAKNLDFGYYDHPPMVGWFLHLMLYLGSSEVVLRLPAILTPAIIGIGIYRLLAPFDRNKASLIAILFLVSPLNILNILVTTDTPLILLAFFSIAALFKALQEEKLGWYVLSGIFFGLAFLSKYFAVLLGLSYLVYLIFSEKNKRKTTGFALLYLASLPFALINLYWNYTHCWDNILFNLYNRNEDVHFSASTIIAFFATQLYLITPPILWYVFKYRADFFQHIKRDQFQVFLFIFLVPLGVFTFLSIKKMIGLHWVLAFYPALYLLLFQLLPQVTLKKLVKFMLGFSAVHLIAIIVIANIPMETWKPYKLYSGMLIMFESEKINEQIRPYDEQNFVLATDGYSPSATISYHYGKKFVVFGMGAQYARQDDMLTNYADFKGRNFLILKKSKPFLEDFKPYFERAEIRTFTLRGEDIFMVLGYNFKFDQYKEGILKPIMQKYYKIPDFLPHAPCYFCEKYFPEECH